ncbi:MAG: hypothetical protein IKF59_04400 [Lachnospiraceae bacterium]|nr:hypothetical protein [Eubacterium sp.]MBR3187263.1 hypothetical protein [Lachnospiraceae bacterium]
MNGEIAVVDEPAFALRLYKEAIDKQAEVEILAQLNGCSVKAMANWLRAQGMTVDNSRPKRRGRFKVRPELEDEAEEEPEMGAEAEETARRTEPETEGKKHRAVREKRMETPEGKMGDLGEKAGNQEKQGGVVLMPEEMAVLREYITAFQTTIVSEDHYSVMGNRLVGALDAILSVAAARNRKA